MYTYIHTYIHIYIIYMHIYYEGVVVPESGDIESAEKETRETGIMHPVS
jgi:hypothetical protein